MRPSQFAQISLAAALCAAISHSVLADKKFRIEPKSKLPQRETGMARDLRLLRKTVIDPKSGVRLSSAEAKQAAQRVFGRVNLVGMTRAQVLWMLGDPETLSDYGRKPKPEKDASLIYCFFNDDGGRCYIVRFKNGRVTRVHGKPKSAK